MISKVLLHLVGFASFLAPTIFVELPIAMLELWQPPRPGPGEEWHWVAQGSGPKGGQGCAG